MHERGYTTTLTPRSNDGGFDLIADRATPPPAHRVLVECKNWTKKVDRPKSQQLLGNLSAQKAPNGLMVTTSGVSAPARKFAHENPRIALLDGEELIRELNLVLGHNWPARIDRLLLESERDCPEQSVRALSERG
jgi:restriction system protein